MLKTNFISSQPTLYDLVDELDQSVIKTVVHVNEDGSHRMVAGVEAETARDIALAMALLDAIRQATRPRSR